MLFITPTLSAQGAKDYFTRQLAPSDYYVRDAAESPGQGNVPEPAERVS